MTNSQIAQTILQIAEILDLLGEDRFRVIAYERAASTVRMLGEDLSGIYKHGGIKELEDIEGVGESIALKIEELLKTGKLKYLEDLKKKVPASEITFLQIPGVGPKTAVKLVKELKVKTIEQLGKKLQSKQAAKYFQEKTRQNILRGIEILKRMGTRKLLTFAMPIAQDIVLALKKHPEVLQADAVGSLRRWKETVGDIDIIAASKTPAKTIDFFVSQPNILQVLAKGDTKATIIHQENIQIDLEILPKEQYGSLLQHFTGSKEHNIALRTWAEKHGFSLSEHGIKILQKGREKLVLCPQETDVYQTLGMDYIAPELREDSGEIQAALEHKLPKLVEMADIKGDMHMHSSWSDGFATIEQLVEKSIQLDYRYIAIADHSIGLGVARGLGPERFFQRQEEIEAVGKKYHQIKILSSAEVNIKADATLDLPDSVLEKLEIVTASIHSSFFQPQSQLTKRLVAACRNPHVDIIGHPSGRILGQREPYQVDWDEIFRQAAATQTALEISSFPNRLDLKDSLCRQAKNFGVKFAINTDSHQIEHLNLMHFGVSVARRGWLEKKDIINSSNYSDLEKWLSR